MTSQEIMWTTVFEYKDLKLRQGQTGLEVSLKPRMYVRLLREVWREMSMYSEGQCW